MKKIFLLLIVIAGLYSHSVAQKNNRSFSLPDNWPVYTDTTLEDWPTFIPVFVNDTLKPDSLSVLSYTSTAGSMILYVKDSGFHYTPFANFFGTDTIAYRFCDSANTSCDSGQIIVQVQSVNDAPVAIDDSVYLYIFLVKPTQDTIIVGWELYDPLKNDFDVDNTIVDSTIIIVMQPTLSHVQVSEGKIAFDYGGCNGCIDSLKYRVLDASGDTSNVATIYMTYDVSGGVSRISPIPSLWYPNPGNEDFIIKYEANENTSVIIYDANGKRIYSEELIRGNATHPLHLNLQSGIYYYQLVIDTQRGTLQKFVIVK